MMVSGRRFSFELLLGLSLRGAGAVASFSLAWLVARVYGAATVGYFQIAVVTMTVASTFAMQGLDRVVVRGTSAALREGKPGRAQTLFRHALRREVLAGTAIAVLLLVAARPFAIEVLGDERAAPFLRMIVPAVLALALIKTCSGMMRSSGRILISQSLDGVSYTGFTALVVAIALLTGRNDWHFLPAAAYSIGTVIVMLAGLWLTLRLARPDPHDANILPRGAGMFIAAFELVAKTGPWLGLIMLAAFSGAATAGIYRVAAQICMLFTIVNTSFAVMAGPRLATAAATGDRARLSSSIRLASLLGTGLCLPLFLAAMIFPETLLGFFGPEFVGAAAALRILAIGELINVAFGPVGEALTMMHRERVVFVIELFATAALIAIVALALPAYGMIALAAGMAISAVIRNAAAAIMLRHHARQLPSPKPVATG